MTKKKGSKQTGLIPQETIENKILLIRGKKVMIDMDLAQLFEGETRHLKRQVRRNISRFPDDFMFQLNEEEKKELVPKWHRFHRLKHSTSLPYAFTEHGALMLANVIKSPIAIEVSILIVRAFAQLRKILASHGELRKKIEAMEAKYDYKFKVVFDAIRGLLTPPEKPKRRIGFTSSKAP